MNKKLNLAFAITLSVFLFSVSANAATYFTANLTGAQEVPANVSTATGFGRVTLNDAETQITASVYYGNPVALGSNVSSGHIHTGAAGVNGPVTFNLAPATGVTSGSVVNASFAVTAQQVANLKAGLMYFNIHTTGFSGGEIRGQITLDAPYIAYMDKNQENPATTATARGSGFVSINPSTNQALVTMNWSGLGGNPTGGHVHSGRVGTNGPVVCGFTMPATTTGSIVDMLCTFSAAQITALKTAQLYLNLHTAANPGGEIRGQIQRRRSTVADFDGDSRTDYAIARNNTVTGNIEYWINNSSNGTTTAFTMGVSAEYVTSRIVPGDFDGDGRDDVALWRSGVSPAAGFLILQSGTNTVRFEQFGTTGDDPRVSYDYDGDARADPAVFRTTDDTWYFLGSSNNAARNITFVRWGTTFANPGDFDGDGRGDFLDQQSGNWWLLKSSDLSVTVTPLGTGAMFGTPGDYDGDGKVDVAGTLTEGTNTAWYYVASSNPMQNVFLTRRDWGPSTGRIRAQGDYDGDGKSDYGVWISTGTPSFWALASSNGSAMVQPFGISTDFPLTGYNSR